MHGAKSPTCCQATLGKLRSNFKDLIWIRWDPKNEAGKKDRAQKPAATVQLDGFNRWPPLLWFWPPRMGPGDPRPPLLLAHRTATQPSLCTQVKHFQERNASESLQWVSTLMLTLQLPEWEPVWLVILDPLFPSPNSCRMASWPEPVQIPSSGLHLIF